MRCPNETMYYHNIFTLSLSKRFTGIYIKPYRYGFRLPRSIDLVQPIHQCMARHSIDWQTIRLKWFVYVCVCGSWLWNNKHESWLNSEFPLHIIYGQLPIRINTHLLGYFISAFPHAVTEHLQHISCHCSLAIFCHLHINQRSIQQNQKQIPSWNCVYPF